MRSIFFKKASLKKLIKITDVIMAVIFLAFWGMTGYLLASRYVERKYIYPLEFFDTVKLYSNEYQLEQALVFSVIKVESSFDKKAISQRGAIGLMQITPSTAEYIAGMLNEKGYDLTNERVNVKFGCYYLRYLIDKFKVVDSALCAYNAGEGNVSNWLKEKEYSIDGKTLQNVPYKETKEYIEKIHKSCKKYKQLYQNILDK